MTRTPNPYNQIRTKDNPYEIWQSPEKTYTYYVLRKYKREVRTQFDRWYCCAVSPITPHGEYGDMYAVNVIEGNNKIFDCFRTDDQTGEQNGTNK